MSDWRLDNTESHSGEKKKLRRDQVDIFRKRGGEDAGVGGGGGAGEGAAGGGCRWKVTWVHAKSPAQELAELARGTCYHRR